MRAIPSSVTRFPLSMTLAAVSPGVIPAEEIRDERGAADPLVGKKLGHFEIIELIGGGGMGKVYRALDTSLQRYVAVKVIAARSGRSLEDAGRARLLYEAVAQARVNHPNIVTIYFVAKDGDTPFLAMELIDGGDVASLLADGPLPYETLCRYAIRITHALDVASQMGIVHSDIKPQNLLLLPNGDVKLSDFGMARLTDDDSDRSAGGTPNYLAPEVLAGSKPTIQSDMYALGVTLYEMTFGRLPVALSGNTPAAWMKSHELAKVEFPASWPEHLPYGWKRILERLLAKNPDERYGSYLELGRDLNEILPQPSANAPRLARLIAWAIDAVTLVLMTIPIYLMGQLLGDLLPFGLARPFAFISNMAPAIALTIYTVIIAWWRQSLGRELLNIQIVNRYGLQPNGRTMMTRTILRQASFWTYAIGSLAYGFFPMPEILLAIFVIAGVTWLLVDAALVLAPNSSSLHDRLTQTRAVIGRMR